MLRIENRMAYTTEQLSGNLCMIKPVSKHFALMNTIQYNVLGMVNTIQYVKPQKWDWQKGKKNWIAC